jgi:gliding motility-associated-like protein
MTPQQLVQNVLLGPGVTAFNITYTGAPVAIGEFSNGATSNLGLANGVLLTSGDIINAPGPNTVGGATGANNLPGDPDLDAIMSPTMSFDACILEFDFIPTGDTVKFRYVFASEEYPEFVSSFPGGINDGFGFFLTGISTPYPTTNIALIPNTTTPITMFNVNCQNGSPYYICNDPMNSLCGPSYTCPSSSVGTTVQYDGFTTVLTAISPVVCGETYHIKIAIGDGGDGVLDSGVFLEAGSFSSSVVSITAINPYTGTQDSMMVEGCNQSCIIFDRGQSNLSNPDTVVLTYSGSAINGIDVTLLPDTLYFVPGQDTLILCMSAPVDAPEGIELLAINATVLGGCIPTGTSLNLYVTDWTPIVANAGGDIYLCPNSNATLQASATGGAQPYLYTWSTGATTSSITVTPTVTTTYYVSITDSCSSPADVDSVVINVIAAPPLAVATSNDTLVYCPVQPLQISAAASGGLPGYIYTWSHSLGTFTTPATTVTVQPTVTTTYTVSVTDSCGTQTTQDVITVTVNDLPFSLTLNNDTTVICPGDPVTLTAQATGSTPTFTYFWNNGLGMNQTVTVSPQTTTSYIVTTTDICGPRTLSDTVTITVPVYPPMQVTTSDATICRGDSVLLMALATGGLRPYTYSWNSGVGTDSTIMVQPSTTTAYNVVVTDYCNNQGSTTANVTVQFTSAAFNFSYTSNSLVQFIDQSALDVVSWNWYFGDGDSISNIENPTHTYADTGTYQVTLIVMNSVGCMDTLQAEIVVLPDMYFYFPSSFTPNGDGHNDKFTAYGLGIEKYEMLIYDRWGNLIFKSASMADGWDGKMKSGMVQEDVYVCVFNIEGDVDGVLKKVKHIGRVALIR